MTFQHITHTLKKMTGEIYWRETLLCTPAIMLVIALSLDFDPLVALIMVGAAFSVGFGASRTLGRYRWGAVAMATIGMSLSACLGSLVGGDLVLLFGFIALLSAGCAYLTSRNNDLWWVSLQVVIAFLVASYYPRNLDYALVRGGLVFTAGFLQLFGMMFFARIFPFTAVLLPPAPVTKLSGNLQIRFVTALTIGVLLSFSLARFCGLSNDYWAPMTALIIMRPSGQLTFSRTISRLIGTLVGCGLATAAIYIFHESQSFLFIALVITSGLAFSMQKANYGLLSCMISATIVFLIALGFGDPVSTTEHRLIATGLGGIVAILMCRIFHLE